ncbi:hypothetical protein IEQ34_000547 [Dendrobium chrysotoxum]|uniref:Uncharacterized protein n=1 Tax=Dendrobium chrysotoxum TaxID=161865 RepID=A0AAV7HSP1_DENCH|nr:hypothetical protein IEQ34_000547 [Dendrobium chrysotoxum]
MGGIGFPNGGIARRKFFGGGDGVANHYGRHVGQGEWATGDEGGRTKPWGSDWARRVEESLSLMGPFRSGPLDLFRIWITTLFNSCPSMRHAGGGSIREETLFYGDRRNRGRSELGRSHWCGVGRAAVGVRGPRGRFRRAGLACHVGRKQRAWEVQACHSIARDEESGRGGFRTREAQTSDLLLPLQQVVKLLDLTFLLMERHGPVISVDNAKLLPSKEHTLSVSICAIGSSNATLSPGSDFNSLQQKNQNKKRNTAMFQTPTLEGCQADMRKELSAACENYARETRDKERVREKRDMYLFLPIFIVDFLVWYCFVNKLQRTSEKTKRKEEQVMFIKQQSYCSSSLNTQNDYKRMYRAGGWQATAQMQWQRSNGGWQATAQMQWQRSNGKHRNRTVLCKGVEQPHMKCEPTYT